LKLSQPLLADEIRGKGKRMKARYFCAVLSLSGALLAGCTTTTTTNTQTETDQTKKRVHTQEEFRKSGESDPGRALEKTDAAIQTEGNR
jgi:hypothetical protein